MSSGTRIQPPEWSPSPVGLLTGMALGLLASGCGTFGLKRGSTDTAEDSAGAVDELTIFSVYPDSSPLNTTTEVSIQGTGFDSDVTLMFGSTEVDVTVLSSTEIIAFCPEVPVEAKVDVTVTSAQGVAVLPEGFTYSDQDPNEEGGDDGGDGGDAGDDGGDDSGDDGGGDSGDDGTDNSGLVTGYVEHNYFVVGCPTCLGFADYTSIEALALFHPPTTSSWYDWFPRQGSCTVNPARTFPTSTFYDVGTNVLLSAGTTTRTLRRVIDGTTTSYQASTNDDGSFVRNTRYDVLAPFDDPPLSAPSVLRTIPSGFSSIEPQDIFLDMPYAFPALSASAARFTWAPAGTADGVMIAVHLFDETGSVYRGEVLCWAADSGVFQVPLSDLATLAFEYDLAMIYYYKFTLSSGINPEDGSTIEAASAFGGIGTATILP
ncbi:MAG: hypothetical protein CL927_04195 [Deltaproteobacteria bacterium]|nr:hypothetical protein [Deltaproteobacteria bacterium]